MMSLIQAEWLKYRRTATPWFVIGVPLALALAEVVFSFISSVPRSWHFTLLTVYNWWAVLVIPFGVSLLTGLSTFYERRAGSWKILSSHPINPEKLYVIKFVVLSVQILAANALFVCFMLLFQFWALSGTLPWVHLALGCFVSWISSLCILAIMLWIATRFGLAIQIVVTLVGLASGIVMSDGPSWMFNPWCWPVRGLEPIFGFQANGLPLALNSPLWNVQAIYVASIISIVGAGLICMAGAKWFRRREVRS